MHYINLPMERVPELGAPPVLATVEVERPNWNQLPSFFQRLANGGQGLPAGRFQMPYVRWATFKMQQQPQVGLSVMSGIDRLS